MFVCRVLVCMLLLLMYALVAHRNFLFFSSKGELNGKVGLFPVPYVQEMGFSSATTPAAPPEQPSIKSRPKWALEDVNGKRRVLLVLM